jgi:energy-coupling factor transporter ATP-binding protein EcfA2
LDNVDLTVGEGEFIAILGRNGSGKTTLARHLIGLLHPDQGKVIVTGRDVAVTPTHMLAKDVGFCFQNPNHQLVSFNVRDEIIFGLKAHDVDPREYDSRVNESLEFVGMLDAREAEIFDLGKGQKQRLALASVLALKPRVLIVDEPTTGQDPYMSQEIFEILKRLNDAGTTVIIVTHRIDYAAAYARRAIVMNSGRVSFDGPIRALLSDLDLVQANSLDLPASTKLSLLLREYGIPPWLTTYEQLDAAVSALLEAANAR